MDIALLKNIFTLLLIVVIACCAVVYNKDGFFDILSLLQNEDIPSVASYSISYSQCGCSRTLPIIQVDQNSSCSEFSTLRGPFQRVVSYSYYRYVIIMLTNSVWNRPGLSRL